MIDGQFDSDRGYLFNYAATGVSASVDKNTSFLIRLAPSVSNAQVGDLGEKELLNRAQLLLSQISVVSDAVSSNDPFIGNTWSSGGTATTGLYYSNIASGIKNWYQATSTGTFSSTAPTFTSGTGASGTYGVNLTWAGATPNNAGAIVIEGILNPSNYPDDPTKITWTGLTSQATGGQPSFAQIASGGSVTWGGGASTATATIQGAFTTTITAKSFAPITTSLSAISFTAGAATATITARGNLAAVFGANYASAISTVRKDIIVLTSDYDAYVLTNSMQANDALTASPYFAPSTVITLVTRNVSATSYTQIQFNNFPVQSVVGTGNQNVTVTNYLNTVYASALSTARTDFLVVNGTIGSITATDVLSAATYITGGQTISSIATSYCRIAGTTYTRIVMSGAANQTSVAATGNNITVTNTSAATARYGSAFNTSRTDFLVANGTTTGLAVGDTLSIATYVTGGQTIQTITPSYIIIGASTYTRIVMSAVANATSTTGAGNDISTLVTASGSASTYSGSIIFFTSASWASSGATIGTRVASDQTQFPAGTSVNGLSTRTFGATTVYRASFTQSLNTSVSSTATLKFAFGAQYALPGEQVFSFITNPGSTDVLDLTELKELTSTAIGGRGTFPNGPDVLAINVYKVSGSATPTNVILRWGEAQA